MSIRPTLPAQPRLRVLAGPNGSGKSTIKNELKPQWIGVFVNVDEIERTLKENAGCFRLDELGVSGNPLLLLGRIRERLRAFGLKQGMDLPTLLTHTTLATT